MNKKFLRYSYVFTDLYGGMKKKMYWMGKNPNSRCMVEMYVGSDLTQDECAELFGLRSATLGYHVRCLKELGMIKKIKCVW